MGREHGSGDAKNNAGALLDRLLALKLFRDLDESTLEAVGFEVRLSVDPTVIPPGMPHRSSYVRLERRGPGEYLVTQGELATELRVVLDGVAVALRAEPGLGTELAGTYRDGDWFGETSALSNQPALTTVRTETECELLVIDARLFRKLFLEDEQFRRRVDRQYRDRRVLGLHLRAAPLLKGLPAAEIAEIERDAELFSFEKGETIARQGEESDAFYLVRSGAVQCYREEEGRRRVLAYYMGNSSFGEHAIATTDETWPGTFETMAWTDVVRIPRPVFESLGERRPEILGALTATANVIVSGDTPSLTRLYARSDDPRERLAVDELEVMVRRQSVKGGEALVIDQTKCIRCNLCVESCVAVHEDRVPRISKVGTRVVTDNVLVTACYHCAIPECMASCDYGAIRRDTQGEVIFVHDNCVGCNKCVEGCPYGVIRMTAPACEPEKRQSSLFSFAFLRGLLGMGETAAVGGGEGAVPPRVASLGGEEVEVQGKAVKCDRCQGLPFEACVYNCPTGAITRRAPEALFHHR